MKTLLIILLFACTTIFFTIQSAFAKCLILTSSGTPARNINDGISIILSAHKYCPKDVFEFRKQIKLAGLKIETTMVANRGYHNPKQGSFSFFEMVSGQLKQVIIHPGDFFFGHFTTVNEKDKLAADQGPSDKPRLMIEAFAWDKNKKLFNFYELIGDGKHNQWFYRGDSADIYADNSLLHLQPDPSNPQFGDRLRCSACHGSGGPIMKEIYFPYNDWWEPNRKLDFGGRKFDESILDIVHNLVPPSHLAKNVSLGIKKLEDHKNIQNIYFLSFQEKLRPLFCPVEINFMSDLIPNEIKKTFIKLPVRFFIDSKLAGNQINHLFITRNAYESALNKAGSHFPETIFSDADHAWLTPVKSASDELAIDYLIKSGLIDKKLVFDVLSIDMTNPIFSRDRCQLLKYVPKTWSPNWQAEFKQNLKIANKSSASKLLSQLNNSLYTPEYHQKRANIFLMHCREKLKKEENIKKLVLLLAQRREEIKTSEISKNPRGQILEPGFRVIFPEIDWKPNSEKLYLTDACEVLWRTRK